MQLFTGCVGSKGDGWAGKIHTHFKANKMGTYKAPRLGEVGEKHGEKRNKRRNGVLDEGRETLLCEFAVSTGTFPQRPIRWLHV